MFIENAEIEDIPYLGAEGYVVVNLSLVGDSTPQHVVLSLEEAEKLGHKLVNEVHIRRRGK